MPPLRTRPFPLPDEKTAGRPGPLRRRMLRLPCGPPARLIMGIDPGLQTTGYGLIEVEAQTQGSPSAGALATASAQRIRLVEAGVVRASAAAELGERLETLFDGLAEVLREHRPEAVVIEELFSTYAHPRSALLMAHARGVLMLAVQQNGAAVYTFLPNEVKQVISGNGHATKSAMQAAVRQRLQLAEAPEPHDVADALALALCFAARQELGQRMAPRL